MSVRGAATLVCASLAVGCDAVPDLYVLDASIDASVGSDASGANEASEGSADTSFDEGDAEQESGPCVTLSCPACAPNPGTCCDSGVPCVGMNCATDCAQCSACTAGEMCCSKQGGPPMCRVIDGGKCPP